MELTSAIERRHMVRSFSSRSLAPPLVDELLERARRAPSAGNSQGTSFLVLDTPESVGGYWDVTLSAERRRGFAWPGLLVAPVLTVVLCDPQAYVSRYSEADKASSGLGVGAEAWPVPYWWVDAGMVVQNLLLGIVGAGLGGCFFGLFDHEQALLEHFGVPSGWRAVGTVAFGHRIETDRPGRSQQRPRRSIDEVIHRNRW